jgi:hypothetical protein
MAWSVAMLEELEGAGIDDRHEQARSMGVSLPQVDRIRKSLRDDHGRDRLRSPSSQKARAATTGMVQLGVRVPVPIAARLRRHAARSGVSVALLVAVALDEWLTTRGTLGSSAISKKEREALSP